MQITNNPISFKSAVIDVNAMHVMVNRMGSDSAHSLKKSICDKYKNSPINIVISSAFKMSSKLCAKISCKNLPDVYLEEGIFASIFRNPKKFFEIISSTADGLEGVLAQSAKK